jgi:hypothetical protein
MRPKHYKSGVLMPEARAEKSAKRFFNTLRSCANFGCTEFYKVRHTKQRSSNSNDMATWHTDMPGSRLDTPDAEIT